MALFMLEFIIFDLLTLISKKQAVQRLKPRHNNEPMEKGQIGLTEP